MDPLDYMVEDCWLHLFQFLPAKDKQALCDTCETFQAILQPQKVEWGLELVLPHILREMHFNPNNQHGEVLRLFRLVCKSWTCTFDKYCAHSNDHWVFPATRGKYDFCNIYGSRPRRHRISVLKDLEKFLTFFKHHSGNPFIGRSLKLPCMSLHEQEEMDEERSAERLKNLQLYKQIFTKYGKEIDYLALRTSSYYGIEFCVQLEVCKLLQFVFCNTPNLQSLRLALGVYAEHKFIPEKLREYFTVNPFPRMTRLRELTFVNEGINKNVIKLLLDAYGENLQSLMLHKVEQVSEFDWSRMRSLTSLKLYHSDFQSTVKILQTLRSPLETLYFEEDGTGTSKVFLIDKFLLDIQHLPLKNITLHLHSTSLKESDPFPRDFPENMTITNFTISSLDFISLDFLQFLPQLKSLIVDELKIRLPVLRQLN